MPSLRATSSSCCQLLRSLIAAAAHRATAAAVSAVAAPHHHQQQQLAARLPAVAAAAGRATTSTRAASGQQQQHLQQTWQHITCSLVQPQQGVLLQQQQWPQLGGALWAIGSSSSRGMATRVEQQAAANPGLKFWKPTSPGTRGRVTVKRTGIWKGRPLRCLTRGVPRMGGRNCTGRITVRHRGGGSRRRLRDVDFQRPQRAGAPPGVVQRLEYDPNRTGYIALVAYPPEHGQQPVHSYILAPQGLAPGDSITSGSGAAIRPGNTMPLKDIPVGMPIHNIELHPGKGGQMCRSAGCMATIVNKQTEHAIVRLPSGEQRLINLQCRATIGAVSNPQNKNRVFAKAGANRWRGRRPTVRGVAMNPVDHPMGGGTAGGRPSCSPWGLHSKGKKTRNKHKTTSRWILSPRSKRGGRKK